MSWSDQEALKHWADPKIRDLIINAVPLDQKLNFAAKGWRELSEEHADDHHVLDLQGSSNERSDDDDTEIATPTSVQDKDLKTFPYQSVGRLAWYKEGEEIKYLTAFYIGKGRIMSAAHGLREITEGAEGFFIPAMANKNDWYGKNYGHYPIDPKKCYPHPGYPYYALKPDYYGSEPECDIFIATVGEGIRNNKIVSIDDVGLTPIPIDTNSDCYDPSTTWEAIGYSDDDEGKMKTVTGKYNDNIKKSTSERISMHCYTSGGMSGGPWMHRNMANGCTSVGGYSQTASPRFNEEKLCQPPRSLLGQPEFSQLLNE